MITRTQWISVKISDHVSDIHAGGNDEIVRISVTQTMCANLRRPVAGEYPHDEEKKCNSSDYARNSGHS